ncbi:unnamed protein product [Ectocarpus sp. 12 AP-2014]
MFVFLDVVWLARILKPMLNHKDEETFDGFVNLGDTGDTHITLEDPPDIASWWRLKNEGILEPRLADAMWPDGLSEYVLPTLASLGLTFPLANDPAGGLVVLLRLQPGRPERVGEVIDTFCSDHTPAFYASWKIFLGVPPGAIEKVLTRCCNLGGVQTFWRYGVLVYGGLTDQDEPRTFAVVFEYSLDDNKLVAQIYGDVSTPAPWVALSHVASAVRLMLLDFPGLRSRGSLKCPQHGNAMLFADKATRAGYKLLERSGCRQCSRDTGGVGAAAIDLVRMVDIRLDRDIIVIEIRARFAKLVGQYSSLSPQGGVDDVNGKLDRVLASTQESLMRLKNLQAPNYKYPRLVAVEKIASCGTSSKTRREKSRLSALCGVCQKDMSLHFLCPVDMSKVPCGYGGEGYRFQETRGWVKTISPVLQLAVVTAKVAVKATSGLDVDLSDFLKDVKDGLVDELVDHTLDEDALLRVLSGDEDISTDMQTETRASYEALNDFMDKEKLIRRKHARDDDGFVDFRDKMKRVTDGRGGMVWVRNENVQKWLDSRSNAAPSR